MDHALGDDLGLLRAYSASGDAHAFGQLVQRYADMVFATARRITGDAAAAEDVSQDCFVRLAQSSASIKGSIAAWLHRTTLNRSLELLRSERSRRLREARAAAQRRAESESDSPRLIARVDEALAALPDELRVPLTEHFLCGRTQTELATSMGVNQSTIHRRIEKGIVELRRYLAAEDEKDERARASPIALPMLLDELRTTTAPLGLRQSLVKVGLSGMRGAAGTGTS